MSQVFASLPIFLVGFATSVGIPREEALVAANLVEADLLEPDELVPYDCLPLLWRALVTRFPDAPLGLRYAQLWSLDTLGIVGYSLRHARNGHEALALTLRLSRLADPFIRFLVEPGGDALLRVRLEHEPRVAAMPEPMEMLVLAMVRSALGLVREEVRPTEVSFRHAARHPHALYVDVLPPGVPVRFGASFDGAVFPSALLDLPLADADPRMATYLARHADALLERTAAPAATDPPLEERVRVAVREGLVSCAVTAADVAKRLAVSVRSLQRGLKDRGTSLSREVDLVRRERALALLERRELTVAEIAFMIGYAESRVFHRSFRRWTGRSPTDYRRDL